MKTKKVEPKKIKIFNRDIELVPYSYNNEHGKLIYIGNRGSHTRLVVLGLHRRKASTNTFQDNKPKTTGLEMTYYNRSKNTKLYPRKEIKFGPLTFAFILKGSMKEFFIWYKV